VVLLLQSPLTVCCQVIAAVLVAADAVAQAYYDKHVK
jgi:hypothetical protein